jgi:hypothetical protein
MTITMMENPWEVCAKGNAGEKGCEIAVVRENNEHGKRSLGWPDRRGKIIIWDTGCHAVLWPCVYYRVLRVAQEVADHLNRGGNLCDDDGRIN